LYMQIHPSPPSPKSIESLNRSNQSRNMGDSPVTTENGVLV
jgi:hypothetical protein